MARYVLVKNGTVENVIEWDGGNDYTVPDGYQAHQHDYAGPGDAWPYTAPQQPQPSKAELIVRLEAEITPRRLREAVLGTDAGWLAQHEAKIAALRAKLA